MLLILSRWRWKFSPGSHIKTEILDYQPRKVHCHEVDMQLRCKSFECCMDSTWNYYATLMKNQSILKRKKSTSQTYPGITPPYRDKLKLTFSPVEGTAITDDKASSWFSNMTPGHTSIFYKKFIPQLSWIVLSSRNQGMIRP